MQRRRIYGLLGILVAVLIAVGGTVVFSLADRFQRSGPLGETRALVIERGAGLDSIARQLESEGIVENATVFKLGVRVMGSAHNLKAGEYEFPAGVSMEEAYAILDRGETVARKMTFAEGLTSAEIIAMVAAAES